MDIKKKNKKKTYIYKYIYMYYLKKSHNLLNMGPAHLQLKNLGETPSGGGGQRRRWRRAWQWTTSIQAMGFVGKS